MSRSTSLLGVLLVGAVCQVAYAASSANKPGVAAESLPLQTSAPPCPKQPQASPLEDCCKTVNPDGNTGPAAFAKVLLCIAEKLGPCPPAEYPKADWKRDRDALLEHITDTLAKLGSLDDDATSRDAVQEALGGALCSDGKCNVAREVLALIASAPAKAAKKVTVTTTTKREGKGWCWPADCTTTETTEVSAEPVAPAPLSTCVVSDIRKKLCDLLLCCTPDKCPPASCARPANRCEPASCFDVRWELINMLLVDAEHQPTQDQAEIADELTKISKDLCAAQPCIAAKLKGIADPLEKLAQLPQPVTVDALKMIADPLEKLAQLVPSDTATDLKAIAKQIKDLQPVAQDVLNKIADQAEKLSQRVMTDALKKIADKLEKLAKKDIAKKLRGMADDLTRIANHELTAEALMTELCVYDKLANSPCGVRILLRVIDGVGDIHEPFKPAVDLTPRSR